MEQHFELMGDGRCEVVVVTNGQKYAVDSHYVCRLKIYSAQRRPLSHNFFVAFIVLTGKHNVNPLNISVHLQLL